jgi:hypothetical protein
MSLRVPTICEGRPVSLGNHCLMSVSEVALAVSLALPPAGLALEAPSHSRAVCFEVVPRIHPPTPSPRPVQIRASMSAIHPVVHQAVNHFPADDVADVPVLIGIRNKSDWLKFFEASGIEGGGGRTGCAREFDGDVERLLALLFGVGSL